jgi:sugar-specific transcriptional regulator TrmB
MVVSSSTDLVPIVRRLGFSELEAEVYCELLRSPGATGYGIGKAIRKPHANVYQGLNGLAGKGAVFTEHGPKTTYTAVPPVELIEQLRARTEREFAEAARALEQVEKGAQEQDGFRHLRTRDQILARARALIRGATATVVFENFPGIAPELRSDLIAARDRGVAVAGMVLRDEDRIEGANVIVSQIADYVLERFRGDQLVLVVDGKEFLVAFLPHDPHETIEAVWVNSAFVAIILHNGIAADVVLHGLPALKEIRSINSYLFGRQSPWGDSDRRLTPSALVERLEREPAPTATDV